MKKWIGVLLWCVLWAWPSMAQSTPANLRLLHLVADAPTLDVYLNGELFVEGLAFGEASLWTSLPTGAHSIILVPEGEAPLRAWAGPFAINLASDGWQSLALLLQDQAVSLVPLNEDHSPIGQGETRLSVFNALQGASPVKAMANNIELSADLPFAQQANLLSVNLIANAYDMAFLAGDQPLATLDSLMMGANRHYLLILAGTPTLPQALLFITNPDAPYTPDITVTDTPVDLGTGDMLLRLAHFSPGVPALDIYLGDRLLASGINFSEMTDYVRIPAGEHDLRILLSGEVNMRYSEVVPLATDSIISLTLTGVLGHSSFDLQQVSEDYSPPAAGMARLVLYHGIVTDKLIGLYANNQLLVHGLAYASAFAGAGQGYLSVDIPAGSYSFVITSDDGVIYVNAGTVVTGVGRYYLIAATGTTDVPTYVMTINEISAVVMQR